MISIAIKGAIAKRRWPPYALTTEDVAMIRGIKFVSVPVKDQDKALAFWTEKCGFKVATDQAFGPQRWIELLIPGADTGLVLFYDAGG